MSSDTVEDPQEVSGIEALVRSIVADNQEGRRLTAEAADRTVTAILEGNPGEYSRVVRELGEYFGSDFRDLEPGEGGGNEG